MALPFAASAQPVTGLYIGAGVGVNIMQQENVKNLSFPTLAPLGSGLSTSGNFNGNTGFAGVLSVGWGFGNGLRLEVEGNYRNNKPDGVTGFNRTGNISGGSTEQKFGGMANVLYDFMVSPWFQPYIGGGVGYIGVSEKWHFSNTTAIPTGSVGIGGVGIVPAPGVAPGALGVSGQGTKGAFAYQAILGAAFPVYQIAPGLAFTAEYRFFGTSGNRTYSGTATAGSASTAAGVQFGPSYNHSILVGLRYNFGQAPPPAPVAAVAPAPAPARSYLVFFDWDKYNLTDRARQIIREAADNSTKVQYTRIEVNGYTDTSGTPKYNQGLSVRRAQAVAAELVKDGVPRNAISIQGFGDTHLLVPTGPGVREPQNRRVEIIIR
jgi:outer membrane protein OmpA-like peptidoglycan-associated protein